MSGRRGGERPRSRSRGALTFVAIAALCTASCAGATLGVGGYPGAIDRGRHSLALLEVENRTSLEVRLTARGEASDRLLGSVPPLTTRTFELDVSGQRVLEIEARSSDGTISEVENVTLRPGGVSRIVIEP